MFFEFSIWVEGKIPGKFPETITHFYLDSHDAKSIYKTLKEEGITPCKGSVFHHKGFLDYKPKSIDEACDLYQEYQHLDDPKDWPLFLKWYQDPLIWGSKTASNFKATFRGRHSIPGYYFEELAIKNGEIKENSPVAPFVDWNAYAKYKKHNEHVAFVIDPLSGLTGIFDTSVFDTSDEAPSNNDSRETA